MNIKKRVLILNLLTVCSFLSIRFSGYKGGSESLGYLSISNVYYFIINNNKSQLDYTVSLILLPSLFLFIATVILTVVYKIKLIQLNTLLFVIYWLSIALIANNTSIFDMRLFYISSSPFLICWSVLFYHLLLEKKN
ncbi:hypothetical protein FIA58_015785 [Flavobacterium jejuense]|uniref:Uncharacterized protein n=1 Tax=Flavobacterium jejuense TaxID=1544455 RepID=A0ABX0IZG5_9FLAO|nr:hypothetical protein [Flavobacterium jejuense]NHN27144.1 hypothetical protein [Flavobacterium jejuense]